MKSNDLIGNAIIRIYQYCIIVIEIITRIA